MPYLVPGTPALMPVDSRTFVDAATYYGMSWVSDLSWKFQATSVDMNNLSAGPPPPPQTFGTSEVVDSYLPAGPWDTETQSRMQGFVLSYLYDTHVTATDGGPLPIQPDPKPAPTDLPPPPPPPDWHRDNLHGIVAMLDDINDQLNWMRSQGQTRTMFQGVSAHLVGEGHHSFSAWYTPGNVYSTEPMGYLVQVSVYPDTAGRSSNSGIGIIYDAGDVSWGWGGWISNPIKVLRQNLVIWPLVAGPQDFYFNLRPGVEIDVSPLYPEQWHEKIAE